MGKFNNRSGFGALRGSKNPLHSTSSVPPLNPKLHDKWTDKGNGKTSFWNGSMWIPMGLVNERTNTPLYINAGLTVAEYEAIAVPDPDTLYFLI